MSREKGNLFKNWLALFIERAAKLFITAAEQRREFGIDNLHFDRAVDLFNDYTLSILKPH